MILSRRLLLGLSVFSCVLLAYSATRAYRLSFIHDECLTYRILLGEVSWKDTANHHPLNTRMMGWARQWLGSNEWQLRLPNVVAHAAYLSFVLLLLSRVADAASILLGFAVFNLNPFVLDFFGLARGYGLALALSTAALFFLMKAYRQPSLSRRAMLLLLSSSCAALADLGNYTWLNFHVSLLVPSLIVLFGSGVAAEDKPYRVQRWFYAAILTGANALFVRNVARRVLLLKEHDQLYGRGVRGFAVDTLGSLVDTYFYDQLSSALLRSVLVACVIGGFMAAAILIGRRVVKERTLSFPAILLLVLATAGAAPVVEHTVLGTEYPVRRIALYYIPVAALLVSFVVDEVVSLTRRNRAVVPRLVAMLLSGYMFIHFLTTANLHHTLDWAYDANTKSAMVELGQRASLWNGRTVNLTNNWQFEPSIRYYQMLLHYEWLNVAPRDALPDINTDVYYGFSEDIQKLRLNHSVLRHYADSDTVLAQLIK